MPTVPSCPAGRRSPADTKVRTINLIAVAVPFAGLLLAVGLLWGVALTWIDLALLVVMVWCTAAGVTVGFHRLFSHRSFECGPRVRFAFAVLGSMAAQGPVIEWIGIHRRHHTHCDDEGDPHTPHVAADEGLRGVLRGLYHAHIGWLFAGHHKGLGRVTADVAADPMLSAVSRQFLWWVLAGLAIPALIGGLAAWSLTGALLGFLWGGLVRIFVVHHVTWSVNSVCHLWGTRPFRTRDESRNNALVGVFSMGDGWHNNHHAFPTSARHGLRWWQLDIGYMIITALRVTGLAWKVRLPSPECLAEKRAA